jgi:hypothetical protein
MRLPRVLGPLLLLGPFAATALAAPPVAGAPRAIPFPGGLLDPSGRTAYLSNASGGLDAVDLTSGELVWQTTEAQVPLLVAGDRLYAQAGVKRNRLRVMAFDLARRGECVLESDPVVLPRWVIAGEAHAHSFAARWRLEKAELVLHWEAKAWSPEPRPTVEQDLAARRHAEGTARIDLETGQVQEAPAEKAPLPPAPKLPRQLERLAVRWHGVVGRHFLALVLEDAPQPPAPKGPPAKDKPPGPVPRAPRPDQVLVLRSWDWLTGKAAEPRELRRGRRLVVLPTLDEKFLCLRDAAPSPDELVASQAGRRFDWSLYSLEEGKIIASVPHVPGTQAVAVVGARAYFLVAGQVPGPIDQPTVRPQGLQAFDLKTGKRAWERPLAGKQLSPPP